MNPLELLGDEATARRPGAGPATRVVTRPERTLTATLLEGPAWTAARPFIDLVALVLAVVVTLNWPGDDPVEHVTAWSLVAFPGLVMGLLHARGMYTRRLRPTVLDGLVPFVGAVSVATMAIVVIEVYVARAPLEPGQLAHVWALSLVFLGAGRTVALTTQRVLRIRGAGGRPTLIVGAGEVGSRLAARLQRLPEYGLRPVGFLDPDPEGVPAVRRDQPVLGRPEDLEWIAHITGAEHVVIAFSTMRDEEGVDLVRRAEDAGLEVSLVPRLFETISDRASVEAVGGLPLVGLRHTPRDSWRYAVKHAFDRAASLALLVFLAPLLIAIAVLVKLSSPGPVLFAQRRVGRDGKHFRILKFRTMRVSARRTPYRPAEGRAPGGIEGTDRRTAVGRVLRRTSLDELPQLVNVLRGDMSLVGPRPERPEFVALFSHGIRRYEDRHTVKSGITGWAQVHGLRGQTSLADRVEWDNWYIRNWSFGLDLKILALTVVAAFRQAE